MITEGVTIALGMMSFVDMMNSAEKMIGEEEMKEEMINAVMIVAGAMITVGLKIGNTLLNTL